MSWFARSIANTFKLDDDDHPVNDGKHQLQADDDNLPQSPRQGVKEDLSEITTTLTRQLRGVASFLAPSSHPSEEKSDPEAISGIRRDFAEIGGKFRTGISKLSNNIDVSEITKIASNFLQMESDDEDSTDDDDDGAVGVTDEVVAFATQIAMHPKTWLDFPLLQDDEGKTTNSNFKCTINDLIGCILEHLLLEKRIGVFKVIYYGISYHMNVCLLFSFTPDFELSDAQQEHALAVERLAPRLGALRIELCPGYMSESSFWKIYFVLLHPRFERHAAELLSTPKVLKARASLTHELKNRCYAQSKNEGARSNVYAENSAPGEHCSVPSSTKLESFPVEISVIETDIPSILANEKHPIHSDEIPIVEKSVIQEEPLNHNMQATIIAMEGKDETDDWLKEEISEIITIPIENDEDVSFSDLEDDDDDDGNIPISYKKPT
ncbi:hypothetical protein OSB04_027127 [Centaurea solstitialis]|uniref:BSD domain-containing protein n=1 Tax=Centaurea solstitialis TaxID=347529 RepID=A0AA38W9Y2_9ASTR|nr:hypothetical protein OSB04_027127 [Centaurea solstitialis]